MGFGISFREFLFTVGTTNVFFVTRVYRSRFVVISGSASGCLGFKNQAFGGRSVTKKFDFPICWASVDFCVIFTCFSWLRDHF